MERLVDRLRSRAAERFVGRSDELAQFGASFAADPPAVPVFVVHGPGGVGKTSLVEQARRLAAAHGIESLRLDGRDVEPTPHGLLRALGEAVGLDGADATLGRVLEHWSAAPRRLLVLDTFECLAPLDGWVRQALLPELPGSTSVIIAGRAVDPAWGTDALWREGARVIALRNLERADCERYLAARGVPAEQRERIAQRSHGHPLALTLLADLVLNTGELPEMLGPDLVRQLAERFTAHAVTEPQRRALEVCAHARVTTEALLADAVDRERAHELFDWLAGLSFVECGRAGLFPHDLVRDAIDDELHWRHRERHREIHLAVRRHLIDAAMSGRAGAASHTFDILFLHRRSPVLGPFVDYRALGSMTFEPATRADLPALHALARSELTPTHHAAFERWFGHRAARTWVVRPAPREVSGMTTSVDLTALGDAERAADPVCATVWRALQQAAPPRAGDRQLLARLTVAAGGQRTPSATMNALEMTQFYQWLTEPRLGAYVIWVEHPEHWLPFMRHIAFERLSGCDVTIDGVPNGGYLHDWVREPLEQWSRSMAEREVGHEVPEQAPPPAPQRLAKPDFERAVREALRCYGDAAALGASPLATSAAVRSLRGHDELPGVALRRALLQSAQTLRERPRDEKFWRALELTYFRPAGSQELAAERLGLPFGTYRYQLATGIERVVQALWAAENGQGLFRP